MRANSLFAFAGRSLLATLLILAFAAAPVVAQSGGGSNNGGTGSGGTGSGSSSEEVPPPPTTPPALPPPIEIPESPGEAGPVWKAPLPAHGPGVGNPPGPLVPAPAPGRVTQPIAPPSRPIGHGPRTPAEEPVHDLYWTGWRGWWSRNHDRYFRFAYAETRGGRRAQTAAGEVLFGLQGGFREWADPRRLAAELPRMTPSMLSWLRSGRRQLAEPAQLGLARLGIEQPDQDWAASLRGNRAARSNALLALGLQADAHAHSILRSVLLGDADEQSRQLGRPAVSQDRADAAHALGVLAYRSQDRALRLEALDGTARLLAHHFHAEEREQAAYAEALGIAAAAQVSAQERVQWLQRAEALLPLLDDDRRPARMRAALFPSLARMLANWQPASSARAKLAAVCIAQVQERGADPSVQFGAVQAFGLIAQRNEGDPMKQAAWLSQLALQHPQRELRPAAAIAMARWIGAWGWTEPAVEEYAIPALLHMLEDGSIELRPWAALALGVAAAEARNAELGAPPDRARKALRDCLEDSGNAELRAACALGLALIGGQEFLPAIRKEALKTRGREPYPEAIHALGLAGDVNDVLALSGLLKEQKLPPASIRALGLALSALGHLPARLELQALLADDHAQRAAAAAGALSHYATSDGLAALLQVLEHPRASTMVLVACMQTLAKWRDARPNALREACVSLWNPLAPSEIDAWARSW